MFLFLCLRVFWSEVDFHYRALATSRTLQHQTLVLRGKAVNRTPAYETQRKVGREGQLYRCIGQEVQRGKRAVDRAGTCGDVAGLGPS